MQLTTYTDYALRALIMLALKAPERLTIAEIGRAYGISEHHLVKVVRGLTQLGYVASTRGKDGGVELATPPQEVNIGQVVRQMEAELGVVACLRSTQDKPCTIAPACRLSGILHEATENFLNTLTAYSLADVLAEPEPLVELLQLGEQAKRPPTG